MAARLLSKLRLKTAMAAAIYYLLAAIYFSNAANEHLLIYPAYSDYYCYYNYNDNNDDNLFPI